MSKTEIILIVLAITADSFATSWFTGALHKKLNEKLDAKFPLFISAGRTVLMAIGIVAGFYAGSLMPGSGYLIGLTLISVIGIKNGIDAWNFNPEERVIFVDNNKTMVLLALAGSIGAFLTGIGLGIAGVGLIFTVAVTAVSTLLFSSSGILAGKFFGYKPEIRFAGFLPGIVVIGIWLRMIILNLL
ncbi:MAG: manganese efflux pump MntP family protein [Lentimicrobium sp.]